MNTSILKLNTLKNRRAENSFLLKLRKKINLKNLSITLILLCAFFSFIYGYLIVQTTLNITVYKNLEQKIISLSSDIGNLEYKYMALKKEVDLNKAKELGFIELKNITYLDRSSVIEKISLRDN